MRDNPFDDMAPHEARLTEYDELHLVDYLSLLDADASGATWQDAAVKVFGIDIGVEPERAKAMHDSHLARARWMTEIGYAHLLAARPLPRR